MPDTDQRAHGYCSLGQTPLYSVACGEFHEENNPVGGEHLGADIPHNTRKVLMPNYHLLFALQSSFNSRHYPYLIENHFSVRFLWTVPLFLLSPIFYTVVIKNPSDV